MKKIIEKLKSKKRIAFILLVLSLVVFIVIVCYRQNTKIKTVTLNTEEDYAISVPSSEYIPEDADYYIKNVFDDSNYLGIVSMSHKKGYDTGLSKYPLLVWESYKIVENKGRVNINVEYPHFWGNGDTSVVSNLNNYIETYIQKLISNDRKLLTEMVRDNPDSFEATLGLSSSYRLIGVTNGIVSLELVSTDFTGGGNGNHDNPLTINWDLKSNRLLNNNELFCSKDYVKLITPLVREQLIKRLSYDYTKMDEAAIGWIDSGITSDESNWKNILVKSDGIIVVFSPYQVSAGASGIVRVFIPNSSISNLLCLPK